mmetsp:Transcript_15181/g.37213  ORF Transcript_15181/g.37213 Transcript_15181/m.37213 type:complete len:203 (+) Transcript_15181:533-1141(+)
MRHGALGDPMRLGRVAGHAPPPRQVRLPGRVARQVAVVRVFVPPTLSPLLRLRPMLVLELRPHDHLEGLHPLLELPPLLHLQFVELPLVADPVDHLVREVVHEVLDVPPLVFAIALALLLLLLLVPGPDGREVRLNRVVEQRLEDVRPPRTGPCPFGGRILRLDDLERAKPQEGPRQPGDHGALLVDRVPVVEDVSHDLRLL